MKRIVLLLYIALIYARRSVRMDEKHNNFHTTPLAFALTVSWLLCIALPHSHSQTPPPLCAEQSYGCSANVSAIFDPFWEQNPPSQCNGGDASSQLICDTHYESQNFTVKDVDNTSRTMTVVPTHTVNDLCSPEFFDVFFKLVNKLLQYYEPVYNITLFSNCAYLPDFPTEHRNFTCWGGAYYFVDQYRQNETLLRYPVLGNCTRLLRVPSAAPLDHYNDFDDGAEIMKEILRDGFGVYYGFPHDCRRCSQSNGSCSGDGGNDEYVVSCKYYCTHKHCSTHNSSDKGSAQSSSNQKGGNWDKKRKLIILGVIGSAIVAVLTSISILCVRYKSPPWLANFGLASKINKNIEALLKIQGSLALKRYKLSQVKKMTNNFKEKLGQGGFGAVYKGKLSNGSVVAVKMLSTSKKNGEEFMNEVASISRTSHVNVVSLLGFCLKGHKRALIYEFMSNGSLDKFIYRTRDETLSALSWDIMYQIARDIARGLEYLHKGCNTRIFHFDIKPHNILLDDNFCAKISDFGLAKLCPRNESVISLSDARGTMGYVAPEMWSRNFGRVSHKSDVYSYGMMLLEMVGGRKNINAEASHTSEIYFPHWAYNKLELENDLRPDMEMTAQENEIAKRLAMVGLWCTQTFPNDRPTMSKVIDMLEGNMDSIQIPPKPLLSSPTRSLSEYSIS